MKRTIVCAALIAGCGAATARPVETPTASAPEVPAEWQLFARVQPGATTAYAADGEGWVGARGRVRFRVSPDDVVTPASEPLGNPIASIAHLGDAWVFVTTAGEVFRGDDPLGALEPVGTLDGAPLGATLDASAHLALLDDRARLFVGDASGISRVASDAPVLDAAFVDASFGARLDLGGALSRTSDGGHTWAPVTTPASQPIESLEVDGDSVVARTIDGAALRVGRVGDASATQPVAVSSTTALPDETSAAVDAFFGASTWGLATTLTPSGRALVFVADRRLRLFPAVSNAQPPDIEWPESCTSLVAWGERFATVCDDGVYATDGTHPFVHVGPAIGTPTFDWRGERYVQAYPCDREHASADGGLCVVDGAGARDVDVGPTPWLLGLDGDFAIVRTLDDAGTHFVAVDLAHGDRIEPRVVPDGLDAQQVEIRASGIAIARGPDDQWLAGRFGSLARVAVPAGTDTLVAADETHFVALVQNGGGAFLSSDGGHTFAPLDRPHVGTGYAVGHDSCGPTACDFGGWIWSPVDLGALLPPIMTIADAPRLALYAPEDNAPVVSLEPRCESPEAPAAAAHSLLVAGGFVDLGDSAAHPWTSGALRGVLGGIDASGPFEVALHAGRISPLAGTSGRSPVSRYTVAVSGHLAVVQRSASDANYDFVALGADAAPRILLDLTTLAHGTLTLMGALPLSDGSIAMHFGRRSDGGSGDDDDARPAQPRLAVIAVVHADATVTTHSVPLGTVRSHVVLARDTSGATANLLVLYGSDAHVVDLLGHVGAGRVAPHGAITEACGAGAEGDVDFQTNELGAGSTLLLLTHEGGYAGSLQVMTFATLHADGSACVREIDALEAGGLGGAATVRADAGELHGSVARPRLAPLAMMACTVAPRE